MKKLKHISMILLICVLLSGLCVAYEAMPNEGAKASSITYYDFYLSLSSGGVTDLATARKKELDMGSASFYLTTITNNTGYPCYINVRNSSGTAIAGQAQTIYSGQAAPRSFLVNYLNGYGYVGTYYRPSGQTSSSAAYGAYIQGEWRP